MKDDKKKDGNNIFIRDNSRYYNLYMVVLFTLLSIILSYIRIRVPGVEGTSSDFREIPVLISVLYFRRIRYPFIVIAVSSSFKSINAGIEIAVLSIFIHFISIFIFWIIGRWIIRRPYTLYIKTILWAVNSLLFFLTLIPLASLGFPYFGFENLTFMQMITGFAQTAQTEIVATTLVSTIFFRQWSVQNQLLKANIQLENHKNNLEKMVWERTREIEHKNIELEQRHEEILTQNEKIMIQNQALEQKQEEIIAQNDKIMFQNQTLEKKSDEIYKRNQLIMKQNESLEKKQHELQIQNNHINSSLEYAKIIQQATLPRQEKLFEYFSGFVLYLPKDAVSGDFYWIQKIDNKIIYAVVDCTGHGVPGAFMSMIGIRLLRSIVYDEKQTDPTIILQELDSRVKIALNQRYSKLDDGMDVSLCVLTPCEKEGYILHYSGAKRPLFIFDAANNKLDEIKGDRISVGDKWQTSNEKKFTKHKVHLHIGDMLYLTTDGFVDQNSPSRKKYGTKRLRESLLRIAPLLPQEQKKLLVAELNEHRQDEPQRDDIAILGIRL